MLLKDKTLSDKLKESGYVVIPFLNANELDELRDFYSDIHQGTDPPHFNEDIHMTTWCGDFDYKMTVSTNLMAIFSSASERFFKNYRRLNNVFIIKKSGRQSNFKVHQDWNIIDETKYESVNVWIPLHDVTEESGALWVLKGSHNINRKVRGAGYLFPEYGSYLEKLEKSAISVSLKAGEAIVFYHSVIHGSPPNMSGKNRIVTCFSVIPENAPLCIYFQKNTSGALEQHQPADDFVYSYDNLRSESMINPPTTNPVALQKPYINKQVTEKELNKFLSKKTLFQKLFRK